MNLAMLLAALEAAPAILADIEDLTAHIKSNPDVASKVQGAVAGLDKVVSDLAPVLKSL